MSKDILPFPSRLAPQRLKYRSHWKQKGLNLGQAEEPEAALDEFIQEANLEA